MADMSLEELLKLADSNEVSDEDIDRFLAKSTMEAAEQAREEGAPEDELAVRETLSAAAVEKVAQDESEDDSPAPSLTPPSVPDTALFPDVSEDDDDTPAQVFGDLEPDFDFDNTERAGVSEGVSEDPGTDLDLIGSLSGDSAYTPPWEREDADEVPAAPVEDEAPPTEPEDTYDPSTDDEAYAPPSTPQPPAPANTLPTGGTSLDEALASYDDDVSDEDAEKGSGPGLLAKVKSAASGGWEKLKEAPTKFKIIGGVVTAFVLIASLLLVTGGDKESPEPPPPSVAADPGGTTPDNSGSESAAPLIPKKVTSNCGPRSTSPADAFSTNAGSVWVCVRGSGIDGSLMNITFAQPVTISEIRFTPGFNHVNSSGEDQWNKYRVVTNVKWLLGGQTHIQKVTPSRTEASIKFAKPITTTAMSMTILKTVPPSDTVGQAPEEANTGFGSGGTAVADAFVVSGLRIIGTKA